LVSRIDNIGTISLFGWITKKLRIVYDTV
jgi:hypothetical protein